MNLSPPVTKPVTQTSLWFKARAIARHTLRPTKGKTYEPTADEIDPIYDRLIETRSRRRSLRRA